MAKVVQYWFNETSGTSIVDSVSGLNLTSSGTTIVDGISSKAQLFGNNTNHIIYSSAAQLATAFAGTAFSIEIWFKKIDARTNNNYLFSYDGQSNQLVYWRHGNPNGKLHFDYANGGAGSVLVHGTVQPALGIWHHAVATLTGTTLKLYLDGKLDASGSTNQSCGAVSASNRYAWGAYQCASSSLGGVLDTCTIYNTVMSEADIKNNYAYYKGFI